MTTARLHVNINQATEAALTELSGRQQATVTEVVKRAISVYKILNDKLRDGYHVVLVKGDEQVKVEFV